MHLEMQTKIKLLLDLTESLKKLLGIEIKIQNKDTKINQLTYQI